MAELSPFVREPSSDTSWNQLSERLGNRQAFAPYLVLSGGRWDHDGDFRKVEVAEKGAGHEVRQRVIGHVKVEHCLASRKGQLPCPRNPAGQGR
ncbi:MAG: hypothetical protein MUE84_05605, partial [Hyphomonas sp.]|nr:hypothetical protein [Hyphomonas sp.]